MQVEYLRSEPAASVELIVRLEERIGQALPEEYRSYLLVQDGGRLVTNDRIVKNIFSLGDVPDYASIWSVLEAYKDRVPGWLLPVSDDKAGNLYAVSLRSEDRGSVWFWDHEREEMDEDEPPTEDNLTWVSLNWTEFLNNLRPFSL